LTAAAASRGEEYSTKAYLDQVSQYVPISFWIPNNNAPFRVTVASHGHVDSVFPNRSSGLELSHDEFQQLVLAFVRDLWKAIEHHEGIEAFFEFDGILLMKISQFLVIFVEFIELGGPVIKAGCHDVCLEK
jgi:hypothetical protein